MAAKKETLVLQERKIPVFTVLKKGVIFKNIFLMDAPSPESMGSDQNLQKPNNQKDGVEEEEILLVGRHPDCNIMLEHPSISRFHLRIHSNPSSQKLSVIDLSSAHGTWVSDRKIEPQVRVEMEEGDVLRLGASTRVYRLHWFPLNRAFEVDYSLLSPIIENPFPSEERELFQNENPSPSAPPMPENMNSLFLDDEQEVVSEAIEERENHSPLRVLEQKGVLSMWSESVNSCSLPVERSSFETSYQKISQGVLVEMNNQETPSKKLREKCDTASIWSRRGKADSLIRIETGRSRKKNMDVFGVEGENQNGSVSKVLFPDADGEEEIFTPDKENFTPKTFLGSKSSKKGRIEEIKSGRSSRSFSMKATKETNGIQDRGVSTVLFSDEEEEIFTPDKENFTPNAFLGSKSSKKGRIEEIKSGRSSGSFALKASKKTNGVQDKGVYKVLFSDEEEEIFTPNKENLTPKSMKKGRVEEIKSMKSSGSFSPKVTKVRSGIQDKGVSKDLFSDEELEIFTPDKENMTPKSMKKGRLEESKQRKAFGSLSLNTPITSQNENKVMLTLSEKENLTPIVLPDSKSKRASKDLFDDSDEELEIFTPDKENMTPKSMKKGNLEESKQRKAFGSLSSNTPVTSRDENNGMLTLSEKENLTPIVPPDSESKLPTSANRLRQEHEMIMEKRREGRLPFKTLVVNSVSKSKSEVSVPNATTSRSCNSVNCIQTQQDGLSSPNQSADRKWYMVVDTSSLLSKESRRSLQLLQGLKWTQLIIPRMVIRELDCLNRRSSLFRRETEASSIFQWIEECMMKTDWWIHVQNSMEEGMPIAPTPPVTPRVNEGGSSSGAFTMPFSTCGSLVEIASPTAQDHILECALLFKRIKTDGKIVLLTNNVALKIKAMAEGVLCETAEDFRESLVNPWSERFLWVNSIPRGPTWTCLEEAGLVRENHHHFPVRKTAKAAEGAKGLKLILLHNSHYGQMNVVA